jgi:hypothetical protein
MIILSDNMINDIHDNTKISLSQLPIVCISKIKSNQNENPFQYSSSCVSLFLRLSISCEILSFLNVTQVTPEAPAHPCLLQRYS